MRLCETLSSNRVFYFNHGSEGSRDERVVIPHKRSFFKKIPYPAIFVSHIFFPNSSFVSINKKQTNKAHNLVWKETTLNTRPVDSHLPLKRMISRIYNIQAKISRIPCLNFGESRFQGSFKIPFPVKIFCVFPNPAPYFGQIPNPENTLQDLVQFSPQQIKHCLALRVGTGVLSKSRLLNNPYFCLG